MRVALVAGLTIGLVMADGVTVTRAQAPRAAPARADQCALCHRGIEDAHPKKTLTCTTCHRGDSTTRDAKKAHAGMLPNPSDLRMAAETCGRCHEAIVKKVKANIMAHRSGTQSGTLFPNGQQPTKEDVRFAMAPVATQPGLPLPQGHSLPSGALARLDPLPTFKESGDVFTRSAPPATSGRPPERCAATSARPAAPRATCRMRRTANRSPRTPRWTRRRRGGRSATS
jgi:hypothetical protein